MGLRVLFYGEHTPLYLFVFLWLCLRPLSFLAYSSQPFSLSSFTSVRNYHFLFSCSSIFLGAFAKLLKLTISFVIYNVCPFFCLAWNRSPCTGQIFIQFDIWEFSERTVGENRSSLKNLTRLTVTLHADLYSLMTSRWIIFRTRNVSEKSWRENQETHFTLNNLFS